MKQAYYIMRLWQTGNVGSHNIELSKENPSGGFLTYEQAEQFLLKGFDKKIWEFNESFYDFIIVKVYSKTVR